MKVENEEAKHYYAVRLDSMKTINVGELTLADDSTGRVKWKDKTGNECDVTLGIHAIRILHK